MDPHSRLLTTKKNILPKIARIIRTDQRDKGPNLSIASPPYAKSSLPTGDLPKGHWDKLQRVWQSPENSQEELSGDGMMMKQITDANLLAVGTPALTRG